MITETTVKELNERVNTCEKVAAQEFLDLGIIYSAGRELTADRVLAHKYFNLAAMSGIGDALRYRKELAEEMDTGEIAEAQRQAREWLQHHVVQ